MQPFYCGAIELKRQNRTESVCAEPLFVIPACETKRIRDKNINISRLSLVEISDRVGHVDGSIMGLPG